MKARHVLWLVFLSLLLYSCSAARHALGIYPRFDTQEEVDEYIKKYGLPEVSPQIYETNYYNVLSWAKEGMDESVIQNKIGAEYARMYLQSTYSSMDSTVSVYHFTDVYSLSVRYGVVDVWLTFIDGKLFSISTSPSF